jgi:hypothetical protein
MPPEDTLAPPSRPPRPLRAVVEVHAGVILGERDDRLSRLWYAEAEDLDTLRAKVADALTLAFHYVGQELRYPHLLNWWNLYTHWH